MSWHSGGETPGTAVLYETICLQMLHGLRNEKGQPAGGIGTGEALVHTSGNINVGPLVFRIALG